MILYIAGRQTYQYYNFILKTKTKRNENILFEYRVKFKENYNNYYNTSIILLFLERTYVCYVICSKFAYISVRTISMYIGTHDAVYTNQQLGMYYYNQSVPSYFRFEIRTQLQLSAIIRARGRFAILQRKDRYYR